MATRVIKSVGAPGYSISGGESRTLSVASDTGAVSGNYTVTSIKINFDKMRHYSNDYYVIVEIGGKTIGETDRQQGYYDDSTTVSRTMNFDSDVKNDWQNALTAKGSITITTVVNSGNGSLNLREGCVVTITVTYKEDTGSGDSGGGSGDDEDYGWADDVKFVTVSETITKEETITLSWPKANTYNGAVITGYRVAALYQAGDGWHLDSDLIWDLGKSQLTFQASSPPVGQYRKYAVYVWYTYNGVEERTLEGTFSDVVYRRAKLEGFTDTPLVVGETRVKALHMTELHDRVNTLRGYYGLSAYVFSPINERGLAGWTDHVGEVRSAIDNVYAAAGKTHEAWINFAVNCPRADVIEQLRNVILSL